MNLEDVLTIVSLNTHWTTRAGDSFTQTATVNHKSSYKDPISTTQGRGAEPATRRERTRGDLFVVYKMKGSETSN